MAHGTHPSWRRYLRFWRADVDADVDDEIRFHLEERVEELVAGGLEPAAARAQAAAEFGDVRAVRQDLRTIGRRTLGRKERVEWWGALARDVRVGARGLARSPSFTLVAALCIALGVCATTTIFSVVHAVLIRPLPYPRADELVTVYGQSPKQNIHGSNISYPDYVSWRDDSHVFAALGIWTWSTHTIAAGGEPERVEGAEVTANLFPLLGVAPAVGRGFLPEEETPGRDHVVLLSDGLWRRRFGADRGVVGRSITLSGAPYTIVGVMPPRFNFPDRGELWVPFAVDAAKEERHSRGYAAALGRLKPGVTLERAKADLAALSARLEHDHPAENTGWAAEPIALREDLVGEMRQPLMVFFGAVALVLLIACANVANLLLARGATRQREMAVRVAVGAGRARLVRQLLTESLLLATVGGIAGAALSVWGVGLLRLALPEQLPFYITLGLDGAALAFALGVSALTGAVFGLVPALRATRLDVSGSLREGSRGASEGPARQRLRGALVVGEVALSLVLLIAAALLVRSYRVLEGTELGFTERGILSMRVSLPPASYPQNARVVAFYDQLLERLRALPGVQRAGVAQGIPFSGWNVNTDLTIEGRPPARVGESHETHFQVVSPDYFAAIGVPLVRGRALAASDRDSLALVGVVNELFVKRYFPSEDPIGKRVKPGSADSPSPWITIVGVYRDYRHYRLPEPMGPALFTPYASLPVYTQTLAIRTALADPTALVPAVKQAIHALDPSIPVYRVQTFEDVVSRSLWRQRLQGQVLGVFAGLALLLAVVGLYGVIAYAVAQRTRELGVRVALGAGRGHVLALVLGQGARLAGTGIVLGTAAALALGRVLAGLLYGVKATDPLTFVAAPALLAAVALLAAYVPARRAMRVSPLVAIQAE